MDKEQNYLFGSLEKAYLEERRKYEAEHTLARTRNLLDKIVDAIDSASGFSSDNIRAGQGVRKDGDTITISSGAFKYGDLMEVGETAVTRVTDTLLCGYREVSGERLEFGVMFVKTEFIKLSDQNPQSRLGFVEIRGILQDADGVCADFPIAFIHVNKQTNEPVLLYIRLAENLSIHAEDESKRIHTSSARLIKLKKNSSLQAGEVYTFSSPIPGDSEDFAQVERIVEKALSPEVVNTYPRTESISEKEHKDEHTLNEIADAIALAREELLHYDSDYQYEIQQKLAPARTKARRIAGSSWKQNRRFSEYKGPIKYDGAHTMWIIDALAHTANGRLEYQKIGITDEVLERAKEILFRTSD